MAEFRDRDPGNNNTNDPNKYEKVIHDDKNFFFNRKIPVYNFPGVFIPAGQYSFPFSFVLPPGLPSTFDYSYQEKEELCFGKVVYEVRSSLENSTTNSSAISHCLPLFVNQQNQLANDSSRKELNQKITSCCCCAKGSTRIVTYFEKQEYVPGEVAFMITEADNTQSEAKITSISATFDQVITLQARGYTKTISNTLNKMSEAGINPGEKKTESTALRMAVSLTNSNNKAPGRGVIQPTCRGKLITNEYFLTNTLHIDACLCCDTEPHCKLKLNVRNPSQQYAPWANQPPTWNPQVMGMANLQFNSEYRFDTNAFNGMPGSPNMPGMPGMPGMAGSPQMPMM